jgi:hypothetical protein
MGWIICPRGNLLAGFADTAYNIVKDRMTINDSGGLGGSIGTAYGNFITIANIVLAVVFLVIIYSEATGNGFGAMNNYNIKKTLPKLIVMAVIVNVSGWICIAAIDLSNILGSGLATSIGGSSADPNGLSNPNWTTCMANVLQDPSKGKCGS